MRHLSFFLFLALSLTVPASAQKQDSVARAEKRAPSGTSSKDAFPLRAIEIEGNENFPSEAIIALSGLEIGQPVRPADFEKGLLKVNEAGVFESLEYRFEPHEDGYRLIYKVTEIDELFSVRFAGFDVPDQELQQLLRQKVPLFGPKVPATGPMIQQIGDTLQAFWKGLGKTSKVDGSLAPLGQDEFEMLFQPREAIKTIAFTKFENATVLSKLHLQKVFHNVAAGVPYSEERVQELLRYNIKPLFEEKGYLEVKFCPCTTEPDPSTEGLLLTVQVEEGEPYTFGQIRLPKLYGIEDEKVARLLNFEPGETANMAKAHGLIDALENLLKANGYMNSSVEFARRLELENRKVYLAFKADQGDRYSFNQVAIQGLDLIAEAAVRKRWGLKVGDPFNASYPALFMKTIVQEGMFDNLKDTGWSLKVNNESKTVDVVLTFR